MKLNIYKNQREIEKTYEVDAYDLMYGTVEDIFSLLDDVSSDNKNDLVDTISKNREKLNDLLKDVFPDITDDELRRIKIKELIPFFVDLFSYVGKSFKNEKN